jgi:hypothetical protein
VKLIKKEICDEHHLPFAHFSSDETAAEEAQARKRQKAVDKKKARWKDLGYESLALEEPEPSDLEDRGTGEAEDEDVTFVIGDVTKPRRGAPDEPAIIVR